MERVFDICHGCRRCFNLCDSFPRLFDLIDDGPTGEARRREEGGLRRGRRGLHALRHVLHDQVPLRAAARVDARFSASDAALSRGAGAQGGQRLRRQASSPRRTGTGRLGTLIAPARQLGDRQEEHADTPRHGALAGIDHGARLPQAMPARPSRARAARRRRGRTRRAPAFGSARRCSTPPASSTTTTPTSARPRARCWPRTASRPRWSIPAAAACRCWSRASSRRVADAGRGR